MALARLGNLLFFFFEALEGRPLFFGVLQWMFLCPWYCMQDERTIGTAPPEHTIILYCAIDTYQLKQGGILIRSQDSHIHSP